MTPLVETAGLTVTYPGASAEPAALCEVDLTIEPGATLGIVGGSGSGKSTLIRVLCGLQQATSGTVTLEGRPVERWLAEDPVGLRRISQLVLQSPASAFDPRMRIARSLAEPVRSLEGREPDTHELASWLDRVGLTTEVLDRFPHQLSGGQLQRVAVARALAPGPRVLYADEPTSALDVSVQAQVLNLLLSLRTQDRALVMVSHDLGVVAHVCDHLLVLDAGRVVDSGPTAEVLAAPRAATTRALIDAAMAVALP